MITVVVVEACLTGSQRARANRSFPSDYLTRRGSSVSRVFVETTIYANASSAGFQPVQNRRRPQRPFFKD
jgi:hypothetical protein